MVKEQHKDNEKLFQCEECGLHYDEENKEKAEECEKWCKEHHNSCNPDIIKYAIESKAAAKR